MSSSTSNSDFPWPGLAWALFFVLLVEAAIRFAPEDAPLTMDQHDYEADDAMDYAAVNLAIEVLEPPDVLILGDSRAREAVHIPLMRRELTRRLGRGVEVHNYSAAAARSDVCLALMDRLIVEDHLPRVLVLPWDAAMLRPLPPLRHRTRVASLGSLPREVARNGIPNEKELANVLGNSMPLDLLRWRPTMHYRLRSLDLMGSHIEREDNAAFGGLTRWLRMSAAAPTALSLATRHIRQANIERSANMFEIGERRVRFLHEIVERARATGVVVVLADIPPSPPLRRNPGVIAATRQFRELVKQIGGSDGRIGYVTCEDFDDRFGETEYLEQSHMNVHGARRYTEILVPAAEKALRAQDARSPRPPTVADERYISSPAVFINAPPVR